MGAVVDDCLAPREFIIPTSTTCGGLGTNNFFVSGGYLCWVSGALVIKLAPAGTL